MLNGEASVHIDAPPEDVYALVADITRMGEWSPETTGAKWVKGSSGPALGAAFRGTNKKGLARWATTCRVLAAEPGREFTFVTHTLGMDVTRWSYRFEPDGKGTLVTESFEQVGKIPVVSFLFNGPDDKRRPQLEDGIRITLERVKAAAERR